MKPLIFRQLFDATSSTYTYLLGDADAGVAALIDPVLGQIDRDLGLVRELGLTLTLVLDTHVHADHVTASGTLRVRTGARVGLAAAAGVKVDLPLEDGQRISLGRFEIGVLATPGHTDSCLSFLCEGRLFTGDALMIRGNGRTDFQQGSSAKLYRSLMRLFELPDDVAVFPAHDYQGRTQTTIGEERRFNPRIGGGKSEAEFARIMAELKLAPPKMIDVALPANLRLGLEEPRVFQPVDHGGIPEITAEQLRENLNRGARLVDVRRPDEFTGELGHIPGAELVTLGPDLQELLETGDKNQEIVFICLAGGRSAQATMVSRALGWTKTVNLEGGMRRWNELRFPVE